MGLLPVTSPAATSASGVMTVPVSNRSESVSRSRRAVAVDRIPRRVDRDRHGHVLDDEFMDRLHAEIGEADEVFANPSHPYTRALLSAVPVAHPSLRAAS